MERRGSTIVSFSSDEVADMIRERLQREGVTQEALGVQISVEQPFGDGLTVHNEVPRLTVILSNAGM